jgi:LPXTG-site transpeptidase (sortase) family protein
MSPDVTDRPVRRARRALARLLAGLALVAVTAACGADDSVPNAGSPEAPPSVTTSAEPTSSPTPSETASSERTTESAKPKASQGSIDRPQTLRIPRIGVNAPVIPIQATEDRVLNPPEDPSVAGWWSDGAAPGEPKGSAVLVGHTVRNRDGGVFDDVGDLDSGDAIEVVGSDTSLAYRVQSVEVLSKEEVAQEAEEIFDQSGAGRLVIITCDDWDGTGWRSNIITVASPA